MKPRTALARLEPDIMRARCLLTIIRRLTEGADALDEDERAGLYVIVCEAEIAMDAATETWRSVKPKAA